MAARHYHSFLILAHLVYILRERVDRHAHRLCSQQLWIIALRMHAQHHSVQVLGYFLRVPAKLFRQQARCLQIAPCRIIDLIITPGYYISLPLQRQRQLVHNGTAYRYKMNFFHKLFPYLRTKLN